MRWEDKLTEWVDEGVHREVDAMVNLNEKQEQEEASSEISLEDPSVSSVSTNKHKGNLGQPTISDIQEQRIQQLKAGIIWEQNQSREEGE